MLYPNKIKKNNINVISYGNRGMDLEALINDANKYYLDNDIAIIYKKPTPIQINKVTYKGGKPEVIKGSFKEKSTLDYVGLYRGKYLDFDAKKTLNKTSFPLENVHYHQVEHIRRVLRHNGIAFLIIEIVGEIYLLPGNTLIDFIDNEKRKSIPYDFIKKNGYIINYTYSPVIDYIKVVDKLYFEKERDNDEESCI